MAGSDAGRATVLAAAPLRRRCFSASSRRYCFSSWSEPKAFIVFLTGVSVDAETGGMVPVVPGAQARRLQIAMDTASARRKRFFITGYLELKNGPGERNLHPLRHQPAIYCSHGRKLQSH